jgi:hypothetical protein
LCLAAAGGCTGAENLDTGDMLVVAVEPSALSVAATAPAPGAACGASDAVVRLLAFHSDGTKAAKAHVALWLAGSGEAQLSATEVDLSADGTSASVCVFPGTVAGMVTLHARSGVIETTADIHVNALVVPSDGTLALTVSAPSGAALPASTCGAPATGCIPAHPRSAAVTVEAIGSAAAPVPDGAAIWLSTDIGWLSPDACSDQPGPTVLPLSGPSASAVLCLSDAAGMGTVTARSGSVMASVQLTVPAVPRSLLLFPQQSRAAAGDAVSFLAFVTDCNDAGVANQPVAASVQMGAIAFDSAAGPIVRTGPDGVATFGGKGQAFPLQINASLSGGSIACSSTIAAVQGAQQ